ncbi:MAG: phosphoribosylformylglycinamidine synthase [Clostridiaceae bacterium]|nr:phosphoribosylformylglycinamidine synthase [Clostridiaceae bacterium]
MSVRRIYVEKKPGFDIHAQKLFVEITDNLEIKGLERVRSIIRYDVEGITEVDYEKAKTTIFSEPPIDLIYEERMPAGKNERVLAVEYLPGQYDQRADSCAQCIQLLSGTERPDVRVANVIVLEGKITDEDYERIKSYCINPVESREASLDKPHTLREEQPVASDVETIHGFIAMDNNSLKEIARQNGFAMSFEDLIFCRDYFRDTEKRDPTITELKMIDTYWSDHCRHTTFLTRIEDIEFDSGPVSDKIREVYQTYLDTRKKVYGKKEKTICMMDIATLAMKELRRTGYLDDLDQSEEINACSIVVDVDVDGKTEPWLVMFKNETHNHPTEIEPFGGAATCLGGAIRDPLSGRSYVYQAMRVTGSGDPRKPVSETMAGKLPQRVITTTAANGYSSYGNQIGLATGLVQEIYHEGYVAKRMEVGAVIAAAPKNNVIREEPKPGDVIILLGGRTGRDGCGGATGSSKEHTEESLTTCGAEVQKGNPPTERKIQRLFRKPNVSRLIKRCNDFGAGGVSVAIGELADGLEINLDAVPKKYQGLDGTELAISESQERMAVVVAKEDSDKFIALSHEENLEATVVAVVTDTNRLVMKHRGKNIVDISRDFLNTNGVEQVATIAVKEPVCSGNPSESSVFVGDFAEAWKNNLQRLNVCSQKGLVEMFDSTVGAGTVLLPLGGKNQLTPAEGMAAKIPVENGDTVTGTLMSFGFNPDISMNSPFHGAVNAVVEAAAKIVAMGGDHRKIRLTLQEYFEKLGKDPTRWAKPFSALMGAFYAQMNMKIPAIGGKDSMSGTFEDLDVPPTLVAFAVCTADVTKVLSPEFKKHGSHVVLINIKKDSLNLPDFSHMDRTYSHIHELVNGGKILSISSVKSGGIADTISKMAFGNDIGFKTGAVNKPEKWFSSMTGNLILEIPQKENPGEILAGLDYEVIGVTTIQPSIIFEGMELNLEEMKKAWESPLESIFPTRTKTSPGKPRQICFTKFVPVRHSQVFAKPRVFIPVFPGTNCEYDTIRAFESAGATTDIFVMKNLTPADIEESVQSMKKKIDNSQIIMIPGGFSAGDEPGGSGKFIATVFRNPILAEAVMKLIKQRDGLVLGICNGFQALIKLGLLPYGEIRELDENSPTLTFNTIGRHVSCLVGIKTVSSLSPWLAKSPPGEIHTIAVSHGEGRFVASEAVLSELAENGQIATQNVDMDGRPTYDLQFNPNGSMDAIEGITSRDGRIFGKMGHNERYTANTFRNVPGEKDQRLFEAGVEYYK